MIQIKDSDILWHFYKKNYEGYGVPHPQNICNYFWNAMFGGFKVFVEDLHALWTVSLLWLTTAILFGVQYYFGVFEIDSHNKDTIQQIVINFVVMLFFGISIAFFGILSLAVSLARWFKYWAKNDERVCNVSAAALAFFVISVMISLMMVGEGGKWCWSYLLIGMAVEVLLILALALIFTIWYCCFTNYTNLGKNLLQYFSAVKDRVCPLVDPPQSYKDSHGE